MSFYKYFLDGVPFYLARYYWWAYLWRPAIWFFDHQLIINWILFGQYKTLMHRTLDELSFYENGRLLQLTCVYGALSKHIKKKLRQKELFLIDVSTEQLKLCKRKLDSSALLPGRMNAECLGFKDDAFSRIILFFLLHELPLDAGKRVLSECIRVLENDGEILITEYGMKPYQHFLYKNRLSRYFLTKFEPFLADFWQRDIHAQLKELAAKHNKQVQLISCQDVFSGFYQIKRYRIKNECIR